MVHENKGEFCEGESEEHCGCMRLNTCTSLAVKLIKSYGKAIPAGIHTEYHAYKTHPSPENSSALCQAVWEHTNPDLLAFIQTYQQYTSKNDVHALLDQLIVSNERESTDDTGDCEDPEKGREVPVIVIHGVVHGQ